MPLPPQAPDKFSPHTRGWSSRVPAQRPVQIRSPRTRGDGPDVVSQGLMVKWVLPAHAGMVRSCWRSSGGPRKFSPHTRGWPGSAAGALDPAGSSPRTRGDGPEAPLVAAQKPFRSPRTRGDGPYGKQSPWMWLAFSPHTRGWPVGLLQRQAQLAVLPAHAGMARQQKTAALRRRAFSPHTRGWPDRTDPGGDPNRRSPRRRVDGPMTDDPMPATACALLRGDLIPRSGRPIARFHYRPISYHSPSQATPSPLRSR